MHLYMYIYMYIYIYTKNIAPTIGRSVLYLLRRSLSGQDRQGQQRLQAVSGQLRHFQDVGGLQWGPCAIVCNGGARVVCGDRRCL